MSSTLVRAPLIALSIIGIFLKTSKANEAEESSSNHGLRGIHLDKLLSHQNGALNKYRSGFLEHQNKFQAHPLHHIFEKGVKAVKEGATILEESVVVVRERVDAHRDEIKARLAAYEEGAEGFHFSWNCAKKSTEGSDVCAPEGDSECVWCTIQDAIGFCTSAEDVDTLADFGIVCGDNAEQEEVEIKSVENILDIDASKSFSLKCVESTSVDTCGQTTDEDDHLCNWCQYNSWIGVCISSDDKQNAEDNLFLTCMDTSMI